MGPTVSAASIPTQPRFAWDAKSPSWTDEKENQEKYKTAVKDWKNCNDTLPGTSPSKVLPELQGILLKFQLHGQVADHCSEITHDQLKLRNGVDSIMNAEYRRDFMSVVSEAYDGFSNVLNTRRGQNESLKSFEARLLVSVAKVNFFSMTSKLPLCITALMLLNNSSAEYSRRVSALSAATPTCTTFSAQSSNNDFLKVLTYSHVSSIVNQCEKSERVPEKTLSVS